MNPDKQYLNSLKAKNPHLYKSLIRRRNELRRIENENEQLRVQKDVLKSALQNITVNIKIGESAFDHIDKMKRLAVEALDELAALESKSNSS